MKRIMPALLLAAAMLLAACAAPLQGATPQATLTPAFSTPTPDVPEIERITVQADPSYEDFFASDPFSQLSAEIRQVWDPDPELYNALFYAVREHEESFDVSGYDLTDQQIAAACDSLYEQAGLQLYYLYRVKYDRDKKRITFQYTDETPEQIRAAQDTFYQQMNHLLYNVAPEGYSSIQRFFSVYDYIARYANYTDDMGDPMKTTVNGVLVRRAGICGSFSMLTSYALNFLQIPTEYVSNEAHAWNIVTLDGSRFQTDLTWGAGWAGGPESNINYILMDDARRMETLASNGFAQYESISGYPRENPDVPLPCTDARYGPLAQAYGTYALDIENNWLYYTNDAGIQRMRLDGTQAETVSPERSYNIAYFDGILYFADETSTKLYRKLPDQPPELLDYSTPVYQLYLSDGVLHYGDGMNAQKAIDLNPFQSGSIPNENMRQDSPVTVASTHTYAIEVKFSKPMDTASLPRDKVGLLTDAGQSLPLHLNWSGDGKRLTIRSASNLALESDVTLYLAPGLRAYDAEVTQSGVAKRIEIGDAAPQ